MPLLLFRARADVTRQTHQTPRATVIIRAVSAPPPTSVPLLTTASTLLTGSVIPPPFGNRFVAEILEGTVDRSSLRLVHRGLVGDAYYQVYMADNVLRVGEVSLIASDFLHC